jgi:peptidoglycan/LPS O-acetylase OafA/YrhL
MRHLDALRIVAASGVVVLHYSEYATQSALGRYVQEHCWHLNLFVDLFFIVSGFVIADQYLDQVGDRAHIARFLWRRLARIYPLHLATLAFYVAIAIALHAGLVRVDNPARYDLADVPAQILLLHAVDGARLAFNYPSWSLSAEFFCYAAFPLIAVMAARNRRLVLAAALAWALANTLYSLASGGPSWAEWINKGGVFRALPAFHLGVALHLFRDRIAGWQAPPALLTLGLAAFVLLGSLLPETLALAAVYLIAVAAVFCDARGAETLMTRLRLDRWSHLTYSSYMLHVPVATVVIALAGRALGDLAGGKAVLIAAAVLVLAAASVASYRWFETPARKALNDAFDRHAWRAVAADAQPGGAA